MINRPGLNQPAGAVIGKALQLLDLQEDDAAANFALLRAEILRGIDQSDRNEVEPFDISVIKAEGRRLLVD